jgi:hypothetical protein
LKEKNDDVSSTLLKKRKEKKDVKKQYIGSLAQRTLKGEPSPKGNW